MIWRHAVMGQAAGASVGRLGQKLDQRRRGRAAR
jgi:hypothetical protein